jgi:hypothetical protein
MFLLNGIEKNNNFYKITKKKIRNQNSPMKARPPPETRIAQKKEHTTTLPTTR